MGLSVSAPLNGVGHVCYASSVALEHEHVDSPGPAHESGCSCALSLPMSLLEHVSLPPWPLRPPWPALRLTTRAEMAPGHLNSLVVALAFQGCSLDSGPCQSENETSIPFSASYKAFPMQPIFQKLYQAFWEA